LEKLKSVCARQRNGDREEAEEEEEARRRRREGEVARELERRSV
jgi:hypothetical protein